MRSMKVGQLCRALAIEAPDGLGDQPIRGVGIDSRAIEPGDCFVAIRGERFDGHAFIPDVLAKQAACVVAEAAVPGDDPRILRVGDTVEALGRLAGWYRRRLDAKVVAITGSTGKTTTRHIIHHVLSQSMGCHQAPSSYNNHIGLPLTLLGADESDKVIVTEIGANHPGEIAPLSRIAGPDIAMVTNVHPAHLAGFGSMEAIIQEKISIAEGLGEDGLLLVNGDFPMAVDACRSRGYRPITFGVFPQNDILATDLVLHACTGTMKIGGQRIDVPLPGRAGLYNALAAWAVCEQFGVTLEQFEEALRTVRAPDLRLQFRPIGRVVVLNDCYNANPASMLNALEMLDRFVQDSRTGRKIFLCGQMNELGEQAVEMHRQLGALAAEHGIEVLAATGELTKQTIEAAKEANPAMETAYFDTCANLCNNLHKLIQPDDIILIKGSRGARLEQAVATIESLFGPNEGPNTQ